MDKSIIYKRIGNRKYNLYYENKKQYLFFLQTF